MCQMKKSQAAAESLTYGATSPFPKTHKCIMTVHGRTHITKAGKYSFLSTKEVQEDQSTTKSLCFIFRDTKKFVSIQFFANIRF